MKNKYKNLSYAIELFSADWELSEEEYTNGLLTLVNLNLGYKEKIKYQFIEACSDPEWSWVKIGYDTNFIGSDNKEESVWQTVKGEIWDVLFPDEQPPKPCQF
jgi:hypothetical protein